MRPKLRDIVLAFIAISIAQISCGPNLAEQKSGVREAAVAGGFYPASADELSKMVDDFIAQAGSTPASGELVAIVASHAGYVYSGKVAAQVMRC